MSTIDNRIVQMRFDNKQFESGVQTSLKSLDNLKKGLDLDKSTKSLENLEKAGKSFSLAGLADGVQTISSKFSALGIMGVTVLQNLTNSAINAGKRIVSALTIDPVKMGFSEYETQINAVQTILANTSSKGTTLTDVNAALDELNAYADRTIYNFTEMTRNIGTFTAAGVDLDTSVQAIKGIANLAAVSGSTSQQASTAMYQLSQALASGTVKLMDWNSVVNAGMGGQVFQDALKETARVHGVKIDKMIKKEGSFRETLQHGWLTSEILTETLSKFTGDLNEEQLKTMGYTQEQIKSIMEMGQMANDAATKVKTFTQLFDTLKEAAQSGWTQSWEIIVGDFEEAKVLLTDVSNVFSGIIGESAEARNSMLQGWKDLGGRSALIESVRNAFNGILDVIAPVKEAFRDIFPPMTGQQLFNLTEGLRKLTERFKIGETTAENLKRTFKGVFALLDIGKEAVTALAKGFFNLIGYVKPAGDGLLGFTAGIGDFIVGLRDAIKGSDAFNKVVGNITSTIGTAITWITNFVSKVGSALKEFAKIDTSGMDAFADKVKARFEPFKALGDLVAKITNGIISLVEKAMPFVYSFSKGVAKVFTSISDAIIDAFNNAEYNNVLDMVNTGLLGAIFIGIKKFVSSITDIADSAGGFLEGITGILDGVKDSLEAYQSTLKAKTLLTIAGAIGILAAALIGLSLVDSEKLTVALGAVTAMFVELFGSMAIFEKIMGGAGFKGMQKVTFAMIPLATSILILSSAMRKLAELDWPGLTKGLIGVAALSATLVISAKSLSKSSGKLIKGSLGLIAFAGAVVILTNAVEKLGALDVASLTKGLIGVGILCAELVAFLKFANLDKMGVLKGAGLMMLAGAVNILATAVSTFGALDVKTLIKGLGAVGIVLLELAAFTKLTENAKHVISTAIGMTILGAAMLIFGEAIEKMGNLSLEQIGKGLLAMAGALAAVTLALNLLPPSILINSIGLIGVAAALVIMSNALKNMGGMSWEEIAKSLVTLAGSLTIIAVAMHFMITALPGAAALLVVAGALGILAPVLKMLGGMSWGEIGKGLLALAGIFAVIGVAGLVLAPLTPVLLALGAAITLFGIGCVAVAAGVLMFSAALSALAISGVAGAAALVTVITSIIGLIPMIVEQIGIAIVVFAQQIAKGGDAILQAVTTILLSLIGAVVAVTPPLVDAVLLLLTTLLQKLAEYVPAMVQAGFDILLGFLRGIRDNISEVVQTGVDIIIEFLDGIGKKIPDVVDAAFDLVIAFIDGLAQGIEKNTPRLVESIINLAKSVIKGLIDGLLAGIKGVVNAVKEIGSSLIQGFKDLLGINSPSTEFKDIGGYIISGLINGLKAGLTKIKDAAVELGKTVLNNVKSFFGIQSPSKVMKNEVGKYIVQGIAEGIDEDTSAEEAAKIKARNIVNAFKTELDKADLDTATADLEFKLWEALMGDKAKDSEYESAMMSNLVTKMELQSKKVELAQGEYEVTMNKLGKNSEDTQAAYNKLLQEQINLANMVNEINALQESTSQRQAEAKDKYYKYLMDNQKTLLDLGFSLRQIEEEAKAVSGYDPDEMETNMTKDIKNAVTTSMNSVESVYSQTAQATFGGLLKDYSNWGASYAKTMADAIKDSSPLVETSTRTMINNCIAILKESYASWVEAGKQLAASFVQGFNAGVSQVKQTINATVESITTPAASAMGQLGEYTNQEFANGINNTTGVVVDAANKAGSKTTSAFSSAISAVGLAFQSLSVMSPVIRPIVDLGNVVSSSKEISKLLGGSSSIGTTSRNNASSISSSKKSSSKSDSSDKPLKNSVVSFVQNISSPKAVSTTEIYRQTKSLFSTAKGLVKDK